jgi:hypothetical protein
VAKIGASAAPGAKRFYCQFKRLNAFCKLHRFGDAGSFRDDYVIFAIPARANKPENFLPK